MDLFETLGEHIKEAEESKRDLNNNIDQKIDFIVHDIARLEANFNCLRLSLVETTSTFTDLSDELQYKFRRVCELLDLHKDVFKIINLKEEYEKSIRQPESFR